MVATVRKKTLLFLAVLCAIALCAGLTLVGCSSNDNKSEEPTLSEQSKMRTFTDSLGRTVEVPDVLDKIAPSGHTAQQVLLSIAPDKMVGLSQELNDDQLKIFGNSFASYPVFGAAFGSKGDMNREAVAGSGAQIIIDTGEAKSGLSEDLDALQEQMGIPVVFIETKLEDFSAGYEMLGELLVLETRAKELADYCKHAYDEVEGVMATIPDEERINIAYLLGDSGLNAIAEGSFQGQVIEMVANNAVVVDDVITSGTGNEVSLEQIAIWDPELIVFQSGSVYDEVGSEAAWSALTAINEGNYYEVPNDPWCWLNNPPTVNQVMGMQWLPRLLYPDKFDTTIEEVTQSYYKTFYNYTLTDAELTDLTANAVPR